MGFIQLPQPKKIRVRLENTRRLRRAQEEHRAWLRELGLDRKRAPRPPETLEFPEIPDRQGVPLGNRPPVAVPGRHQTQHYSGERKLLGIATMHKSNMVPVFDEASAKDIAKMRR
jgi:hypothetical protein